MARTIDKDALWRSGLRAIDDNIEAIRDDLMDKGWTDEAAINAALNEERYKMMQELSANIEGNNSYQYEKGDYADLNDTEEQASDLVSGEDAETSEAEAEESEEEEEAYSY